MPAVQIVSLEGQTDSRNICSPFLLPRSGALLLLSGDLAQPLCRWCLSSFLTTPGCYLLSTAVRNCLCAAQKGSEGPWECQEGKGNGGRNEGGYPMRRERKSKNRRKSKSRSERAVTYSEDRRKKQRLCYHWDPFPGP